jgi:hypothetical protein
MVGDILFFIVYALFWMAIGGFFFLQSLHGSRGALNLRNIWK